MVQSLLSIINKPIRKGLITRNFLVSNQCFFPCSCPLYLSSAFWGHRRKQCPLTSSSAGIGRGNTFFKPTCNTVSCEAWFPVLSQAWSPPLEITVVVSLACKAHICGECQSKGEGEQNCHLHCAIPYTPLNVTSGHTSVSKYHTTDSEQSTPISLSSSHACC